MKTRPVPELAPTLSKLAAAAAALRAKGQVAPPKFPEPVVRVHQPKVRKPVPRRVKRTGILTAPDGTVYTIETVRTI